MQSCRVTQILVAGLIGANGVVSTFAAEGDRDPIEASRQALKNAASFPWYDSQFDRVRPVGREKPEPLRQSSNWVWEPKSKSNPSSIRWWENVWRFVQYLVWFCLVVLLVVLVYFWIRSVVRRAEAQENGPWSDEEARRHEADSIEQLPFHVDRPAADLLGEAKRFYQAGDYRQAIIYLFSFQLVQLDRHQHIRLAKSKTNRQYMNEVRSMPELRKLMTQSMFAFEDVFFGHYDLDRSRFEACWNRLDEFDGYVQRAPGT